MLQFAKERTDTTYATLNIGDTGKVPFDCSTTRTVFWQTHSGNIISSNITEEGYFLVNREGRAYIVGIALKSGETFVHVVDVLDPNSSELNLDINSTPVLDDKPDKAQKNTSTTVSSSVLKKSDVIDKSTATKALKATKMKSIKSKKRKVTLIWNKISGSVPIN